LLGRGLDFEEIALLGGLPAKLAGWETTLLSMASDVASHPVGFADTPPERGMFRTQVLFLF